MEGQHRDITGARTQSNLRPFREVSGHDDTRAAHGV